MAVPNTALYFAAYDELRRRLAPDPPRGATPHEGFVRALVAPALAGALARIVAATAVPHAPPERPTLSQDPPKPSPSLSLSLSLSLSR